MKERIKIIRGAGLTSIQVWTEELPPYRYFPAYAVLVDVTDDGSILWDTHEAKEFRANLMRQILKEDYD